MVKFGLNYPVYFGILFVSFKTRWVIDKSRLDKEYAEQIFPDLTHEIFSYFKEPTTTRKFVNNRNITYVITDIIKIIIGVIMIIWADCISKFTGRKSKNIIDPLSS